MTHSALLSHIREVAAAVASLGFCDPVLIDEHERVLDGYPRAGGPPMSLKSSVTHRSAGVPEAKAENMGPVAVRCERVCESPSRSALA
jgi:hypothetical protein